MILSVWRPLFNKRKIFGYEKVNNEIAKSKKGTSNYKVIWLCDDPKCRTPKLIHSISNCHLKKPKMCYDTQICRPCQCTGEGNGRWGDNRTWDELHTKEKSDELKKNKSKQWLGNNNPSKSDDVKIKKNQVIINEEYIENIVKQRNLKLLEVINIDGKKSKFKIECHNGHVSNKIYSNFVRKNIKYDCQYCYYESMSLNLSDEDIKKIELYMKQVRTLTAKTYRKYKDVINPLNLPNGKHDYHIDHKYSLCEGFKNNVPPKIISAKENLQMLYYIDNLSKNNKCSITLEELLSKTEYLL